MYFVKLRVGTGLDTEAPVFREDLRPVSHFEGLGGTTALGHRQMSSKLKPPPPLGAEEGAGHFKQSGCVLTGDTVSPALVTC